MATTTKTKKAAASSESEEQIRARVKEEDFAAKIESLKKKYSSVFVLEIEDKRAFLKPIGRQVIGMATALAGDDQVKICEMILDNCWIEGDECIRDDDEYFIPAMGQIQELMQMKSASLKKL